MTKRIPLSALGLSAAVALTAGAAAPAVAKDQVLTLFNSTTTAFVRNFNPFNEVNRVRTTRHFIYEPLIVFNTMDSMKPHYRLATGYQFSEDGKSVTFTLREGVKWSDGKPFTADDVVFSLELVRNNEALDPMQLANKVTSVEKVDDYTVRLDLTEVNTLAVYEIVKSAIVPKHIWSQVDDPITFTNENPVGTGPMTEIKRFRTQIYEQCRNPNYWDADSLQVDCLRVPQFSGNDQALIAAQKGQLDWLGMFIPDIDKVYVARDKENHNYWLPPNSFVYFLLNTQAEDPVLNKTFSDVNFRRAFSMALDRETLRVNGAYGYPVLNDDPTMLGAPYADWRVDEIANQYKQYTTYSAEGARQLLAEAGYKDIDGDGLVETPDGEKLQFKIMVPNGWTDFVNVVTLGLENLRAVGIDAGIYTPEATVWFDGQIKGNFEAALGASLRETNPYSYYELMFHSRHMGPEGNRFAANRLVDKELDAILDRYPAATTLEEQRQIIAEAQARVAENLPVIPLYNNPMWYQYNTKRFTGFWNAQNPGGNPQAFDINPERLMLLLSLEPTGKKRK